MVHFGEMGPQPQPTERQFLIPVTGKGHMDSEHANKGGFSMIDSEFETLIILRTEENPR